MSQSLPTQNIGQLPISPEPTKRIMVLPSSHSPNGIQSVTGNEGGTRSVLIISNDKGNRYSPTVIVAAITSKKAKGGLPTHFCLDGIEGLPANSIVLLEQIRTIDKKRLREHLAQLAECYMEEITAPLLISIGVKNVRKGKRRSADV